MSRQFQIIVYVRVYTLNYKISMNRHVYKCNVVIKTIIIVATMPITFFIIIHIKKIIKPSGEDTNGEESRMSPECDDSSLQVLDSDTNFNMA